MTEENWDTVRRSGKVYCSRHCGRGCTHKEYKEAKRHGEKLAKRLGPGWKPKTRHDEGWRYLAECGPLSVFFHDGLFWCWITVPSFTFRGTGSTPEKAIADCSARVGAHVSDLLAVLAAFATAPTSRE